MPSILNLVLSPLKPLTADMISSQLLAFTCSLALLLCPSHGGSYMAEGQAYSIRIGQSQHCFMGLALDFLVVLWYSCVFVFAYCHWSNSACDFGVVLVCLSLLTRSPVSACMVPRIPWQTVLVWTIVLPADPGCYDQGPDCLGPLTHRLWLRYSEGVTSY